MAEIDKKSLYQADSLKKDWENSRNNKSTKSINKLQNFTNKVIKDSFPDKKERQMARELYGLNGKVATTLHEHNHGRIGSEWGGEYDQIKQSVRNNLAHKRGVNNSAKRLSHIATNPDKMNSYNYDFIENLSGKIKDPDIQKELQKKGIGEKSIDKLSNDLDEEKEFRQIMGYYGVSPKKYEEGIGSLESKLLDTVVLDKRAFMDIRSNYKPEDVENFKSFDEMAEEMAKQYVENTGNTYEKLGSKKAYQNVFNRAKKAFYDDIAYQDYLKNRKVYYSR